MELFMRNIDWNSDKPQVITHLAGMLHRSNFSHLSSNRMNFHVYLHSDKNRIKNHSGRGTLTLPSIEIGQLFLQLHGSDKPQIPIVIGKKIVFFSVSKTPNGRVDVVEQVRLKPYVDPYVAARRDARVAELSSQNVSVTHIQFGWECRDFVFSIECEEQCASGAHLAFNSDRREIRINFRIESCNYYIAIPYSHINTIHPHYYLQQEPVIFFALNTPPTYETDHPTPPTAGNQRQSLRRRLPYLPIARHKEVASYVSLSLRIVCTDHRDLQKFRQLCGAAQLNRFDDTEYPIDRRNIFSSTNLDIFNYHLRQLNWIVAFQVEALVRGMVIDVKETLDLIPYVRALVDRKGKTYAAMVLRKFYSQAEKLYWSEDEVTRETILQSFRETEDGVEKYKDLNNLKPTDGSLYDALHVKITPTSMFLEGPFPERSNRVIRTYNADNHESFLRVSFVDEARLSYRFDREVDGRLFINERVGPFLKEGLIIAGRKFKFLAYSQSALKEHSVWFVKQFRDPIHGFVDARSIIKGLGDFRAVTYDQNLIFCPARYAARLSQAFTATDAVIVDVEEIFQEDDITTPDKKYQFTDGVGKMSKELAKQIWTQLKATKKRKNILKSVPSSYQIRFMGSKGMLSVDYKMTGLTMCLRPSMIKFDAPSSNAIEIARAFDRPGNYFLNRPLIMLLEGLGVNYNVFKEYQDRAVNETHQAVSSLNRAAALFESYGLGSSYRIPSIMLSLTKLGISYLPGDKFYQKFLEDGINHVLRDLKNHARIPIPGAWTLVGVADVHRYLQPDEIFACVKPNNGRVIFLEGPVLISRSPTIHPGDVRIVRAIGKPPVGSCFAIEPLANTVVFSVLGIRPVPSCLGGGDLDGDVYNLIPLEDLPEFCPEKLCEAASYDPARKKLLDRPSTMEDVADFVMEFINSDVVGIVATNWLIIADQSDKGIFDDDCIKLANIHSDAVDYPKSGQPVELTRIPKLKHTMRPDWNAPETVNLSSGDYYESSRAIGKLFRTIHLPAEQEVPNENRRRRRNARNRVDDDLADALQNVELNSDGLFDHIEDYVSDYIGFDSGLDDDEDIKDLYNRYISELQGICISNTLSHARGRLTEEEAVSGTIVQKSSQLRKRKDAMARLRESTDILVRAIRENLLGDETLTHYDHLRRAWRAFKLGAKEKTQFGAQSFSWVALGAIFEAIRNIEKENAEMGYYL